MSPIGHLRRLQRAWRAERAAAAREALEERFGPPPWPVGYLAAMDQADKRAAARARSERPTRTPDPMTQIF